jgi:four helix bundle protein
MTSVGANYDEAKAASSKGDFIHKIKIALKEARESNYWLRMLVGLNYNSDELQILIQEAKNSRKF